MNDPFARVQCVVVKVGSSLLIDAARGTLKRAWLKTLCEDIAALKKEGAQVVLVSSGAIALGRRALKLKSGALRLEESQAAAAVGQVGLAHAYAETFADLGITAAQILLTLDDTEERRRYLNARATMATLLGLGSVPVINENDTVATAEIRFGDNDRLAARVASMMGADRLVLLSDVDGLYTADPTRHANAQHIPNVKAITPEIEAMAGGSVSGVGRGGMASKLIAARIATQAGADVIIAKGETPHPLAAIRDGARATRFRAVTNAAAARKRWIAGGLKVEGTLRVDAGAAHALASGKSLLPAGVTSVDGDFERGAARALATGKSLLPAGVTSVDGDFERGAAVRIAGPDGREIARGISAYSAHDAQAICGRQSAEIAAILGYRGRDAMIHRDDMALTAALQETEEPQA